MPDREGFDLSELHDVYRRVYREPPYFEGEEDVARFRTALAEDAGLPGFAMTTVHAGDQLGGFAYGVQREAGWWHPRALSSGPAWLGDVPLFYVYELAVLPELRGRGHGRSLLDDLLKSRSERFAVLAARAEAPARELYRRWGWQEVGELSPGGIDLLALRLS